MTGYSAFLQSLSSSSWALSSIACLLLSSWFFGRLMLQGVLRARSFSKALDAILHLCAGLDLWALLALSLGSAGLLSSAVAKASLLSAGGVSAAFAVHMAFKSDFKASAWSFLRRNALFLALALALGFLFLGNALCLPFAFLDEQAYQLPIPTRWLSDSFPFVYKDLAYSGYPSPHEFLLWLLVGGGKLQTGRLLCLCLSLLSFGALYLLLRARVKPFYAFALSASFALAASQIACMSEVLAEPFVLLNFLCGLALVFSRRRVESLLGSALALGLFAGACAASKLTAVAPAALLFVGLLFLSASLKSRVLSAVAFAAGCLFAVPFYLRPFLQTGNPLHPYFSWLFSSDPSRVETSAYMHFLGGSFFYGSDGFLAALLSPLRLSLSSRAFDGFWGWHFAALFGACLLSALLAFRNSSRLRGLTLYCGTSFFALYVFWFCSSQQARFLGPAVCLALLAAAPLFGRLKGKALACVSILLLASAALPSLGMALKGAGGWIAYLDRAPERAIKATWRDGLFDVYAALDKLAPRDAKAMLVFERRVLFCPRPAVLGTPLYQEAFFTPTPSGSDEEVDKAILDGVARSGVSYLVVCMNFGKAFEEPSAHERIMPFWRGVERLVRSGKLRKLVSNETHLLLEAPGSLVKP